MEKWVDLRRDTITLPTPEMKEAAFRASLGDSVYGEDSEQRELEELAARVLDKEEAIFVPSGTMGNLIAVLSHTERGNEIILEQWAHIRTSETGGSALVGGIMMNPVPGPRGVPEIKELEAAIRPDNIHYPRTALVCLESSHYRYGGIVAPLEDMRQIREVTNKYCLPIHLDGARLFNAALYLGVAGKDLARLADSVMVSLSKGLGSPVGSILAGEKSFITRAKRYRKLLGGGMRQTGWLCACGRIALSPSNIARLEDDHRRARILAEGLNSISGVTVNLSRVHTNFVLADLRGSGIQSETFLSLLRERKILATFVDDWTIRMVTSRQVNDEDIEHTLFAAEEIIKK
ncbi:MAG: threonine aldolase [Candidatus Atribacteria bacterium]|nr:threonine aldolase [Candidatus Atribacteria bacterium]